MDSWLGALIFIAVILAVAFSVLSAAIKVVQEYERGVIFRLGRLVGAKGPGLFLIIPLVDRMVKVDLRVVTADVPAQEAITKDNVTVRVNAVLYFRVFNPENAVVAVTDYVRATHQIAQTTLRSVLGQSLLDELLSQREEINIRLQQIIDEQTEPWGIKVGIVEVKDVELPVTMQRAMARQAEAEREKRAKVIHAAGEYDAAQRLSEAAHIIGLEPTTIQLRYLQTLTEIASERNSTIIFPIPIELISLIPHITGGSRNGSTPHNTEPMPPHDTVPVNSDVPPVEHHLPDVEEMRVRESIAEHNRFISGDESPENEEAATKTS